MVKQKSVLLNYLRSNRGGISALQAMNDLGIGRLSARVKDLRDEGYIISCEKVSSRNRYGKAITYGVYRLEAEPA